MNECTYPGFKADVITVIKDYFLNSEDPLIPISFYEIFISILVVVERHDHMCSKKTAPIDSHSSTQVPTNMCRETELSFDHSKTSVVNKCFDISEHHKSLLSKSSTSSNSTSFFESCEIEQSKMEHKPLNVPHKYSKPKLIRTTSSPEISVRAQSYYQKNMEKIKRKKMGLSMSKNLIYPKNLNKANESFYSNECGFKNQSSDYDQVICPSTSGYVNFGLFQSEQINNKEINGFDLDIAISALYKLIDITQMNRSQILKHQLFNGI